MEVDAITAEFVDREFALFSEKYELGIEKLKNEQVDVIVQVLRGKDTIGNLPTGFGKSVVFYALPFLKEKMESGWNRICSGDYYRGFDELCSVSPLAKEALIGTAMQYFGQDMLRLLRYTTRLREIQNAEELQMFSWEEVLHEANDLCPDLVTLIDHLLQQYRHVHRNSSQAKVKRPNVSIGMILSLLLHYQDPANYRTTQQIASLLLHLSGCKEQLTYLSLSHLGICLGPASTLDFVSRFRGKTDVCETFKKTDLGSLGSNSVPLKFSGIAQKRKEKKEQEKMLQQLKEEAMELEEAWEEQLKQAAADVGLNKEDLGSSDSDDSTEESTEDVTSSNDSDDNDEGDELEEIQFHDRQNNELKHAAEVESDKKELASAHQNSVSSYSTDYFYDTDGSEHPKEDDSDDNDEGDKLEEIQCHDQQNNELKHAAEVESDKKDLASAHKNSVSSYSTDYFYDTDGSEHPKEDANDVDSVVTDHFDDTDGSEHPEDEVEQNNGIETRNTENGFSKMALESSPSMNAKSLCVKLTQIDLKLGEPNALKKVSLHLGGQECFPERCKEDRIGASVEMAALDGDADCMEIAEPIPQEIERAHHKTYFSNKRSSKQPGSSPKRPKKNEESMDDGTR